MSDLLSCGHIVTAVSISASPARHPLTRQRMAGCLAALDEAAARGAATNLSMQHLLPCTMPTAHHSKAATSCAGLQVKPPGNQSWDWSEKQHRLVWRHKKVQGGTEHTLKVIEQAA